MNEQFVKLSDDVELCYETFGSPSDPAVLLIMGLATQMHAWHADFCGELVDRGFFVIRYDNRDVGKSSRMQGAPPSLKQMFLRDERAASYSLLDMAGDAIGLLDHLGVDAAHVVGASMGGMIAQTLAIEHPQRLLSLTSIMSNTGGRWTGQPAFTLLPIFLRRPPRDRDAYAEHVVTLLSKIGSSGFERDPDEVRAAARLSFDRGISAAGNGRQLAAVLADGDRSSRLADVRVPTLVIHGTGDRLVRPSGGRATAKAIPGAELLEIEGMGHDLPRGAWDQLIDGIVSVTVRASRESAPV